MAGKQPRRPVYEGDWSEGDGAEPLVALGHNAADTSDRTRAPSAYTCQHRAAGFVVAALALSTVALIVATWGNHGAGKGAPVCTPPHVNNARCTRGEGAEPAPGWWGCGGDPTRMRNRPGCSARDVEGKGALNAVYSSEGVVFRGFENEASGNWSEAAIIHLLAKEFGALCDHEPGFGAAPCSAPATFVHPNISKLQHLYASMFYGTPGYSNNRYCGPSHKSAPARGNPGLGTNPCVWVFAVFRGCQASQCTYPEDAWSTGGCNVCPATVTAADNARRILEAKGDQGHTKQCGFPATATGTRDLVTAQNILCSVWNGTGGGRLCEENQRQLYWSGADDVVAIAYLDKRAKPQAVAVAQMFTARFCRPVRVMFPWYDAAAGTIVFDEVWNGTMAQPQPQPSTITRLIRTTPSLHTSLP